jgi:hypothetical protein
MKVMPERTRQMSADNDHCRYRSASHDTVTVKTNLWKHDVSVNTHGAEVGLRCSKRRHGEKLRCQPLEAQPRHERRRKQRKARKGRRNAKERNVMDIQPIVQGGLAHLRQGESFKAMWRVFALDASDSESAFVRCKPLDGFGVVWEDKKSNDGESAGYTAFNETKPARLQAVSGHSKVYDRYVRTSATLPSHGPRS